ncbi:MAG: hypothetical protein DSM106950_26545 [Stigonema ocellatum SAG 48.90 = DSM 106950]|nr:hypothetical protein [Stigonema ocellatum SAG 48.90 = DSM 106950]
MRFTSKVLAVLTSSLGLFSINFAVSPPAQASVVCETGTASNYQNNSLATCILGQVTNIQVYSPSSGSLNFNCQAKRFISFDDKAQFRSCQLSQEIKIQRGNSIQICPAEYKVYVSSSTDGAQSINCSP